MKQAMKINLCLFDGNEKDETKEDLIDIKDPSTGNIVQIPKDLKKVVDNMISIARRDVKNKLESQYKPLKESLESLQGENEDIRTKLQEFEDSGKSEIEKLQSTYKRNTESLEKKLNETNDEAMLWKERYNKSRIKTDIYEAFGEYQLSNPDHAAILFMNECNAEIEEKIDSSGNGTGEFQTIVKMIIPDGDTFKEEHGTPKNLFKKWIEQDKNKHLLVNNLIPGAGSAPGNGSQSMTELKKLETEYDEAMKAGNVQLAISLKPKIGEAKKRQEAS